MARWLSKTSPSQFAATPRRAGAVFLVVALCAAGCGGGDVAAKTDTGVDASDTPCANGSDAEPTDLATAATPDASDLGDIAVLDAAGSEDVAVVCTDPDAGRALDDAAILCDAIDPTVCFGHLPGADATVADVPMPQAACCGAIAPTFAKEGEDLPAPTLALELGVWDPPSGGFVAYQDGDWAALTGSLMMSGFHVSVGFRLTLPGVDAAKVKLQVSAQGLVDCQTMALGTSPVVFAERLGDTEQWQYASEKTPGVQVRFPYATNLHCAFCGRWLDVRIATHNPTTNT